MATEQIKTRQLVDEIITNAKVATGAAIASTKLATWSANRDAGNNRLTNLANASSAQDAVTLSQLQDMLTQTAAGLAVHEPARVASTADVGGTYNSTGGASATGRFTGMSDTVDGIALAANDRVLVKDQTNPDENGIYRVGTLGTGSNGVWDRADDFDEDADVTGSTFVFVQEGTVNEDTQWVLTSDNDITVGTASGDDIVFTQFGAGNSYTADEVTLQLVGSQFSIKNGGVGTNQLAADAVTNAKLADNAVQQENLADNSVGTAEIINGNVTDAKLASDSVTTIKILDLNVTTGKLAADAVTNAKLADNAVQQENIADNSVGTAEIIDANVTTAKLAANAVTGGKISFINQTVTGTVDGVNDDFTLSAAPTAASLIVWVNGLRQRPTTDYTLSGTTITFTTPPETGDTIAVFGIAA